MVLRKKCHDIIKGLEKILLSSTYINYVLIYKFLPHFSVKCINLKEKCINKNADTLNLSGSGRHSDGIAYKIKVHSQFCQ